jgi:7-cyano-7-deazaguanine synthase in queuosine biosynthesis
MAVTKVICELSGGADSALAAIYAKKKYPEAEFFTLFVDYGQSYAVQEQKRSLALAKKIFPDTNWKLVEVKELYQRYLPKEGDAKEYFPSRNLLIASISAVFAAMVEAQVIVTGSKSFSKIEKDPYSFQDSTLGFYAVMEAAANRSFERDSSIRIEPLLAMGRENKLLKFEVMVELAVNGIVASETWSCYHPTELGGICGKCFNCVNRKEFDEPTV